MDPSRVGIAVVLTVMVVGGLVMAMRPCVSLIGEIRKHGLEIPAALWRWGRGFVRARKKRAKTVTKK